MEFKAGSKVQAVDELGRWESGVIEAVDHDAGVATVRFIGWDSDFNVTNPLSKIRKPVDIFSSRIGSVIPGKRCPPEKLFMPYFRTLEQGDGIKYRSGEEVLEGTVEEVDPFLRQLVLEEGVTIHGSQLVADKEPSPEPKRRRLSKKPKQSSSGCQRPSGNDASCDTSSLEEFVVSAAVHDSPEFHFAVTEDGLKYECGDIVELAPQSLVVLIQKITMEEDSFFLSGPVIINGLLDSLTVCAPICRFKTVKVKASKQLKNSIRDIKEISRRNHRAKLLDVISYRKYVRKMQIRHLCRKELATGLQSTVCNKKFCIGLICEELDDPIMVCGKSRRVFNIRTQTMHELDGLLGRRWDILSKGELTRFVTEMAFVLSETGMLHARISFATCTGSPGEDYRHFLWSHIQCTRFGGCEQL